MPDVGASAGRFRCADKGPGAWNFYKVAPKPGETIITKHRYDAFHQTDLELVLRTNALQSLVLNWRSHQWRCRSDFAERVQARLRGHAGRRLLRSPQPGRAGRHA